MAAFYMRLIDVSESIDVVYFLSCIQGVQNENF